MRMRMPMTRRKNNKAGEPERALLRFAVVYWCMVDHMPIDYGVGVNEIRL